MKNTFVVLGGGAMGTAIAQLLGSNGHEVMLWLRDAQKAVGINKEKVNYEYLPGAVLPCTVVATADLLQALQFSHNIIIAVPSHAVNSVIEQINSFAHNKNFCILSIVKGLDYSDKVGISSLISKRLRVPIENIAVLGGPNFATELVEKVPSMMIIASKSINTATFFKEALQSQNLIVFTSADVEGIEVSSVLKNITAIAMGIVDGLGFGANTRGAIFPLCLDESIRIATGAFNAKVSSIMGPSCLGDAITTGFSTKSRNYLVGLLLSKKASLGNSERSFLCEGKNNIHLIKELAEQRGIDIPITNFVYETINGQNAYPAFFRLWAKLKATSWPLSS